jgi:hypothetical protein
MVGTFMMDAVTWRSSGGSSRMLRLQSRMRMRLLFPSRTRLSHVQSSSRQRRQPGMHRPLPRLHRRHCRAGSVSLHRDTAPGCCGRSRRGAASEPQPPVSGYRAHSHRAAAPGHRARPRHSGASWPHPSAPGPRSPAPERAQAAFGRICVGRVRLRQGAPELRPRRGLLRPHQGRFRLLGAAAARVMAVLAYTVVASARARSRPRRRTRHRCPRVHLHLLQLRRPAHPRR